MNDLLCTDNPDLPDHLKGGMTVIGNFDGVHRGHQMILSEARNKADHLGIPLTVLTFEPHPRRFFRPDDEPFRLMTLAQKQAALAEQGVDGVIALPFNKTLSQLSPQSFIDGILVNGLGVKHVGVGADFRFGYKRAGSVKTLSEAGKTKGFDLTVFDMVTDQSGQILSSTAVRDALRRGDLDTARYILTKPWSINGKVIHGDKRGREMGYPTANMRMKEYLHPAHGVYAARVTLPGGEVKPAAAHFGVRPMFDGYEPLLEAYIFAYSGDLYDRTITVDLIDFIRPEVKFATVDHLKDQMADDIKIIAKQLQVSRSQA